MSDRPEHLCLGSLTDYNPRVYLTEQDYPRMAGFHLDGRMVYQYQDKELNRPNGIYVDSVGPEDDSLIVGCYFEPRHDKTYKMSVRPAKTQIRSV